MAKQYSFGIYNFKTQKELNEKVKQTLAESPRDEEFQNDFFKELINSQHEGVKKANLKVSKFKIITYNYQINEWAFAQERFRGGILMTGFFEPINKWHGVTVYPHKKTSEKSKLINALRQKWAKTAPVRNGELCEQCMADFPVLHHKNITFQEIAEQCMCFFTEEELKFGLGDDWWLHENEADALADNHPAVLKMFELHKDVTYEWLCDRCHKTKHKKEVIE